MDPLFEICFEDFLLQPPQTPEFQVWEETTKGKATFFVVIYSSWFCELYIYYVSAPRSSYIVLGQNASVLNHYSSQCSVLWDLSRYASVTQKLPRGQKPDNYS